MRRLVPTTVLLMALAPAAALAQVNIDQGKTPAQVFAADCATCHKSVRGLANGRGSSALASFLSEHYTSSRDQAAALAAYVLGAGGTGGGGVPPPSPASQTRGPKPGPERARGATEEPKPATRQARRSADEPAKPQPAGDQPKPDGTTIATPEPSSAPATRHPGAERHEKASLPARGRRNLGAPPDQTPATVVASPAAVVAPPAETQTPNPSANAATPADAQPGETSPVPRDNIPD